MEPAAQSAAGPLPAAVLQYLEALQRSGVTHLPKPAVRASAADVRGEPAGAAIQASTPPFSQVQVEAPIPAAQDPTSNLNMPRPTRAQPSPTRSASPPPAAYVRGASGTAEAFYSPDWSELPVLPEAARREVLERLCTDVRKCRRCPVLVANRTQTVFGVGNLRPRLCFFGEAPGADEDQQGEPFVGRAGQLLNKMIEAMTLRRDEVYILNVLKCRPPDNRPPDPEEAENCRPFFERQLEVLRPEYICCLGASAVQALLKTRQSIGKLRGKFMDYGTSKVLATYHPSYLLRNPSAKRLVWDDLQQLMAHMGLTRS